jgi:hypothetical protein
LERPSQKLGDAIEDAIELRIDLADRAVEAARATDPFTGRTLAEATHWAALQAERHRVETELAVAEATDLLATGKMDDAVRRLESDAETSARIAAREALGASDAALAMRDHAAAAVEAVEQARALIALAQRPDGPDDAEWLARASARVTALSERAARVQWGAKDAGQIALTAAATSIQANVALDVARANLEMAGLRAGILANL